jgi:RNA polymerase sigma factor (sigma-70 family)
LHDNASGQSHPGGLARHLDDGAQDENVTVTNKKDLTVPFEESRPHLRAVAYRMLGSRSEADDAVQETWLRLSRADTSDVDNLRGWLTTVVARVCLDMLRSRKARAEDSAAEPDAAPSFDTNAEEEAVLVDSVGLALLVVLEMLEPAERLAFVLHDLFGVSFEAIARAHRREIGARCQAAREPRATARARCAGSRRGRARTAARSREGIACCAAHG